MQRIAILLALAALAACSGGSTDEAPAAGAEETTETSDTTTTASGLQITHIVKGSGASPTASDQVRVHYHGTFPDGSVFDSSVDRGDAVVFPLGGVIPCWTEGLQLMHVGGKAKLVCPPSLAYGPRGVPPRIPPSATLHFEVELFGIQ